MGKRKEITGKDNGKQKMWIMITVIIVFFAMAGYAGMSYYYSDRFFRGTTINGINCSGKTSEEAEQAVAKKAEDYLLEVKARNLKSLSFNFLPIKNCIRYYKKKICSIFCCEVFDIMVSYMYERKSCTLPHLCVQY